MIRTILATTAIALALPIASAQAGDGDAAAGEKLARSACAMCHKLPDGSGAAVGPAFAEIAGAQAPLKPDQLIEVLNQPQHAPAKSQVELPAAATDLAAYLNGLK
jgi:cytochrome c2